VSACDTYEAVDEKTKAYLAGLIDGEGHIGINRVRTSKSAKGCKRGIAYRLTLSVRMTDRRPLDFALQATGRGSIVSIRREARYRLTWGWSAWSREAAWVLEQIRPFLIVKAESADVALEFQAAMRWVGRRGLSDAEWDLREVLCKRIKEFNYGPHSKKPSSPVS
jgi:hypothetical protein